MTPELLKRIIADQQEEAHPSLYIIPTSEKKLDQLSSNREIGVIAGVRRCGKSVLLQWIRHKNDESDYYLNFEDERLVNFTVNDIKFECSNIYILNTGKIDEKNLSPQIKITACRKIYKKCFSNRIKYYKIIVLSYLTPTAENYFFI